jgi:hypothetical protein
MLDVIRSHHAPVVDFTDDWSEEPDGEGGRETRLNN